MFSLRSLFSLFWVGTLAVFPLSNSSMGLEVSAAQKEAKPVQDQGIFELVHATVKLDDDENYLKVLKSSLPKLLEKSGDELIGLWVNRHDEQAKFVWVLAASQREQNSSKPQARKKFWDKQVYKAMFEMSLERSSMILKATDFSEKITPITKKSPAIYELRTYTPAPNGLEPLLERFRNHTCGLFAQHGMTNLYYWTNEQGQLVYFLEHQDEKAAAKSFQGFRSDPKWTEVREASEAKFGGSLTVPNGVTSEFYEAIFLE